MGNCYVRQRIQDYIDKDIRIQRKIGAEISVCKSDKKIGLDTNMSGVLESTRQETYQNNIPRVIDLVSESTQTI